MAGKEIGTKVFDSGLSAIKAAATAGNLVMRLTEGWVIGDTYATVLTKSRGNVSLADADVSAPANDGSSPPNRRVTISAKTIPGASTTTATGDLHIVLVDSSTSSVLAVTDETTDQDIVTGNPVNVPSFTVGFNQLTQP